MYSKLISHPDCYMVYAWSAGLVCHKISVHNLTSVTHAPRHHSDSTHNTTVIQHHISTCFLHKWAQSSPQVASGCTGIFLRSDSYQSDKLPLIWGLFRECRRGDPVSVWLVPLAELQLPEPPTHSNTHAHIHVHTTAVTATDDYK